MLRNYTREPACEYPWTGKDCLQDERVRGSKSSPEVALCPSSDAREVEQRCTSEASSITPLAQYGNPIPATEFLGF